MVVIGVEWNSVRTNYKQFTASVFANRENRTLLERNAADSVLGKGAGRCGFAEFVMQVDQSDKGLIRGVAPNRFNILTS